MKIQIQRFGRDIKSLLGWASLKQSALGQNQIVEDLKPDMAFCVDCLNCHDLHEEATMRDPKTNEPLCGECYGNRVDWYNECRQAQYDWQPLYDDRGI